MSEDISYLFSHYWQFYLKGTLSTIILSVIGTFSGLFLGIFLAFGKRLTTKNLPWYQKLYRYPIKFLCSLYSLVIRGTPMMVQAMLFKYGSQLIFNLNWNNVLPGVDTFNGWLIAGLIVITFNTAAYMGEIVIAGLNGIDPGQNEGARSLGMNSFETLFHVTLPQALRNSIPTIGNEWVVNIKDSSVLNVIAVSELFYNAESAASKNYKYMATYLIIACIYLLLTVVATLILKFVEFKLDGKKVKVEFSKLLFHFHHKKEA